MFKYTNILLKALADQKSPLLTELRPVTLEQRDVLYEIGSPIEYAYFMESGVGSFLTTMSDGGSIEVGMVGFEGLVGFHVLLGEETSPQQVIIQLPGKAYKVKASLLKKEFEENVAFRNLVLNSIGAFIDLSGQTAACNRLHMVEERCARWLLMTSDRTQSNFLPLTHEYLSVMVGVRRSGISEAAADLQRMGLIRYKKGQIEIIDRPGLEKVACECYALDSERFQRVVLKKQ